MIGALADQLKQAGITSKQIQQFDVFSVPDDVINFPEERLGKTRTKHPMRLVIILQNDQDNNDPTIKIATIAPLSTSKDYHRLDYLLKKLDHPFLRDDSYIRVRHIQPILKNDLSKKCGNITQHSLRENIRDRLFSLYDLSP